jgi:2-keto-4-pentenoate hydratase/2-oxohepta-3-ene-1,7-dioic acid hydratase in catechol pathway
MKISVKSIRPTKIICVGLNYIEHARELGLKPPKEPVIFLKPPSSLIYDKDNIVYPPKVKRLDFEAELAAVIKKKARNIKPAEAQGHILGYTCLNDVTARDLQKKDGQWTRSKSFDTFCPIGPVIETGLDPSGIKIESYLNGALKQSSSSANLIFSVSELVAYISGIMTLLPGDIISTGTPPGVGPMRPRDVIEVRIEGIGTLKNKVVAAGK